MVGLAQFSANIDLKVQSQGAERQVKKLERGVAKVEAATRDILGVDKQIVRERRVLIRLDGEQATRAKKRIRELSLQKTELSLQKRELQQINRLEKQRISNVSRGVAAQTSSGGVGSAEVLGAGLIAARALTPKQLVSKSKALKGLEEFRDRQKDSLDATIDDLDAATRTYKQRLDRFNEVRAKRPLLTSKGTFQPTTRTSRNSLFSARDALFESRADANSQSKLVGNLDTKIAGLTKELDASARAAKRSESAFGGLRRTLVQLGLAFGALELVRFITNSFKVAAAIESQQIRLKALSAGFDDYQSVLLAADRAQGLFNLTQQEAIQGFGTAYSRLRPLGLTLEQVQAVYEGFNVAAINSGTTAAEAAGAFTQLTQALGAGALRGDELRSVLEQTPAIASAIARELGVTIGQLKEFGKDGKISSETVLKALVAVRNEGINKLSQSLDTPVQKFKKLEIAGEKFRKALADEALPAVTEAVENLSTIITQLEGPIRFIGRLANQTLAGITDLINAATKPGEFAAAQSIRGGRLPFNVQATSDLFKGTGPQGRGLAGLQDQATELSALRNQPRNEVLLQLMQDRLTTLDKATAVAEKAIVVSTDLSGVLGDKDTTTELDKDAADRATAIESKLRGLNLELITQKELNTLAADLAKAELAGNKALEIRIKGIRREVLLGEELDNALARETDERVQQLTIQKFALKVEEARIDTAKQLALLDKERLATEKEISAEKIKQVRDGFAEAADIDRELNAQLTDTEVLLNNIGGQITNGLVDGLQLAVSGVDNLGESFQALASDILSAVGNALILAGIKGLGGGDGVGLFSLLSGGLGGNRASGGPFAGGMAYITGEKGPELFIPSQNGQIIPSDPYEAARNALGGSTTESASGADAFIENQASLGTSAAAAQTRSMQELLVSTETGTIRVEVDTVSVGGLDVITTEQFAAGMEATAKQARAQVFSDMRKRPATRRSLGLN